MTSGAKIKAAEAGDRRRVMERDVNPPGAGKVSGHHWKISHGQLQSLDESN